MSKIIRALGIKRKISEFSRDHGTFVVNVEDYQNVCDQKDSMLEALIENILDYDFETEGQCYNPCIEKQRKVVEKDCNKPWNEIKELIQKV